MNRKDLLMRLNQGRKEIDSYILKLNNALRFNIEKSDFLDLEKTDEIQRKFKESFKTSTKILNNTYTVGEKATLENDIKTIAQQLQQKEGYLLTKSSETCGAVSMPVLIPLNNYDAIIEIDGDSLNLVATDYSNYIYLDYYEEHGEFFYQLFFW